MLEELAPLLDAVAMMSVPLNYSQSLNGRLYLLFGDGRSCGESDLGFLHHVIKHVMPLIANIRLMDQLVIDAANEERRKVARDIHDSVLQPFLGLRLGLAALKQTMANGDLPSASTIDQLVEMNDFGIEELRAYLAALRSNKKGEETLVPAVRRFATRFSQVTGIDVQVEAKGDVRVSDRLAEEAVRIVAEGLSNVNRHTQSERATAGIECRDDHLVMRIGNDSAGPTEPPKFIPKSISERASAAGGQAWVEADGHSGTAVVVKIPL
jgi:signal transduction histidine kinase